MTKIFLESAWWDIPLSTAGFKVLTGRDRHTFVRHKLLSHAPHRYGVGRVRGHLDPQDIPLMQLVIKAMIDRKHVNRDVLDQLLGPDARSNENLVMKILGFSKHQVTSNYRETEASTVDPYHLLHRDSRPRNQGHLGEGQEIITSEDKDSIDEFLGDGEEVSEFVDLGKAPDLEWDTDPDTSTDQVKTQLPDNTGPSVEAVPESEREFLALADIEPAPHIEGVDESGDSYLADIGFQDPGDSMANFQPWEQDFD